MAQLGISLKDAELIDIGTYIEVLDIQKGMFSKTNSGSRRATQQDIDMFLL